VNKSSKNVAKQNSLSAVCRRIRYDVCVVTIERVVDAAYRILETMNASWQEEG
jgi:hypothetical protein